MWAPHESKTTLGLRLPRRVCRPKACAGSSISLTVFLEQGSSGILLLPQSCDGAESSKHLDPPAVGAPGRAGWVSLGPGQYQGNKRAALGERVEEGDPERNPRSQDARQTPRATVHAGGQESNSANVPTWHKNAATAAPAVVSLRTSWVHVSTWSSAPPPSPRKRCGETRLHE